jgi:hypothetical protein
MYIYIYNKYIYNILYRAYVKYCLATVKLKDNGDRSEILVNSC